MELPTLTPVIERRGIKREREEELPTVNAPIELEEEEAVGERTPVVGRLIEMASDEAEVDGEQEEKRKKIFILRKVQSQIEDALRIEDVEFHNYKPELSYIIYEKNRELKDPTKRKTGITFQEKLLHWFSKYIKDKSRFPLTLQGAVRLRALLIKKMNKWVCQLSGYGKEMEIAVRTLGEDGLYIWQSKSIKANTTSS